MDQRHQEYVEYYRARLKRYEASELYPNAAAAERALFEAISTAAGLEEFKTRVEEGRLPLRCAIARVRDQETARAGFCRELEEVVREQPSREILEKLDGIENVQDLSTMVSDVETRWQLRISADEVLLTQFWGDWKILEDIECTERAEVPERWHEERRVWIRRELERGAKHQQEHTLPELRKFFPDYVPNWSQLWETRHRRRIPLSDEIVRRRIEGHQRYVGGK